MKNFTRLFALAIILFTGLPSFSQQILLNSEDWEVPSPDWTATTSASCTSYPWYRTASTASTGSYSAYYDSYNASSGCYADLFSPYLTVDDPEGDDSIYLFLDFYRDASYSTYNDKIELSLQNQNGQTVEGPSHIHRYYLKTPAAGSTGWLGYYFPVKLSKVGTGNNVTFRFVIRAVSNNGNSMYVDNINIYHSKKTPPAGNIILTNPNGGNTINAGSQYNITWFSTNVSKVNIDFTINGGLDWVNIASNVNATDYTYTWTVPATSSPTCKVRIVNASNAADKDESDNYFTIRNNTSVKDISTLQASVYPNPSNGKITIEYAGTSTNITATVFDLTGKMLHTVSLAVNGKMELDLSEQLANGIYMLELNDGVAVVQQKLVINK